MYIDKMTLFILGEVFVVYLIVSIFLFHRSRLLKVLISLLKELRRARSQREQAKARELARQYQENRNLAKDINLEGPETFSNHLEVKIQSLTRELEALRSQAHDTDEAIADEVAFDIRKSYLILEQQIEQEPDREKELIEVFIEKYISTDSTHSDTDDQSIEELKDIVQKLTGENVHYRARIENLERFEGMYEETHKELANAREALANYQTIDEKVLDGIEPRQEKYTDKIHQLKSENFDLKESINKLRLEAQQGENLAQAEIQEKIIADQSKYMKEADVCISLLEKELDAANKENIELQSKLIEAKQNAKSSAVTSEQHHVEHSSVNSMQEQQSIQKSSVETLKSQIEELKNIEQAQNVAEKQEVEINKLERSVMEAEGCITVLESELDRSTETILELELEIQKLTQFEDENERLAESLEELLESTKDMTSCIEDLEQKNKELQAELDKANLQESAEDVLFK